MFRLYSGCTGSIAEVLIGFDIDCCSVGYDGVNVWTIPRARRAINHRCNLVDMSQQSFTYEIQLNKYAARGFAVGVPGLALNKVNWDRIATINPSTASGLTRLLAF